MSDMATTILLVEDDAKSVLLTQRAIRKAGLPVSLQVVGDVKSARAYLDGEGAYADRKQYAAPQMVLLDLYLPDGSGHELLSWIRSHQRISMLPVVMLTVSGAPQDVQQALAAGASSYLIKPVDAELLADLVHGLALPLDGALRVLMIDDDERVRMLASRHLCAEFPGIDIELVSSAAAFDRALEHGGHDLVITDYQLPWTDGLTVVRACKAHWRECPVIMFTASGDEHIAAQGMNAGLDDYVLKSPAHLARLCGAVRLHVGRRRLREARRKAAAAQAESERRYRRLFEAAIEGIVITDAETLTVVDVNPALCALLGYSRDDLIGRYPWMVAPPGDAQERRVAMEALARVGGGKRSEATLRRADGELITVERDSSVYLAGDRRLVQCHIRDITERKMAEEGMRQALERAQNYLDIVGVIVLALDVEGRVTLVNREGCRVLGYPEHEIVGKLWVDTFVPPAERAVVQPVLEAFMAGDTDGLRHNENLVLTDSGEERLVAWRNAPLWDHEGHLIGVLSSGEDITERRRTQEALAESEARYRVLVDSMEDSVHLKDRQGRYVMANQAMTRYLGITPEEVVGKTALDIYPEPYASEVYADDMRVMESGEPLDKEERALGGLVWLRKVPIRNEAGTVTGMVTVARNIEARRQLERQLRQAQKMEAVGRLAGGIAHDFNNLLAVINGYCEMLLDGMAADASPYAELQEIHRAGQRAASLTRQLLTFSRRRTLERRIVQPNDLLTDLRKMLVRLIGEDIRLSFRLQPQLGMVEADPGQIEQAIMNLVVNARDAMPDGGDLTITSRNIDLTAEAMEGHPDLQPGSYVCLSVADTGLGMTDQVRSHLFEPFFTTKEVGKGTGLGLATVWGIMQEYDGAIEVESVLGRGSTFSLYFPKSSGERSRAGGGSEVSDLSGTETLLVVEDQDAVRAMAAQMLARQGYRVLEARNGVEALKVVAHATEPISLVITDVVMPEMGGQALAEALRQRGSELKVLFMSGYTDRAESLREASAYGYGLLEKPFTRQSLWQRVREVLDAD